MFLKERIKSPDSQNRPLRLKRRRISLILPTKTNKFFFQELEMRTYTHLLPMKSREALSPTPCCPVSSYKTENTHKGVIVKLLSFTPYKSGSHLKRSPRAHTTEGLPMDFLQHTFSIKLIGTRVSLKTGRIYQIAVWNKLSPSPLELLHRALFVVLNIKPAADVFTALLQD